MIPQPLTSTLFPYTTLFRSSHSNNNNSELNPGPNADNTLFLFRTFVSFSHFSKTYKTVADDILPRSEEHTSELQSRFDLVCRLLLEKKNISITLLNIDASRL